MTLPNEYHYVIYATEQDGKLVWRIDAEHPAFDDGHVFDHTTGEWRNVTPADINRSGRIYADLHTRLDLP